MALIDVPDPTTMPPSAPHEPIRSPAPAPDAPADATADGALSPGTKVEVRRKFDDKWARGFEVASFCDEGYRLRRLSDGEEIPVPFVADDVRREKKNKTWWY